MDGLFVTRFGGADEVVIADFHGLPKIFESFGNLIDEFLRGYSFGGGVFLNLFAVFIGACKEKGLKSAHPLAPSDDIGKGGAISVS